MKINQKNQFLSRYFLSAILIAVSSGAAFAADDEDLSQVFKPEDFGLRIGMAEQEMLGALASQGFGFKAGGKYERVQGSKQCASGRPAGQKSS